MRSLRFLDLLLHMGAGYRSLPRLQCAALHFQRLSDGDFMEPDVLNFYWNEDQQTVYGAVFTGCDRRSNDGSWTDVEYCRDI